MNKDKLTSLCRKISEEKGLAFNSVMNYFFLESILYLLGNSLYKKQFIFKGGFLLSNVVGINTRSTVDIDFLLNNMELSEERLNTMLHEVLEMSEGDISYRIQAIKPIKEQDEYGGFRVIILCRLENIRQIIPLDTVIISALNLLMELENLTSIRGEIK